MSLNKMLTGALAVAIAAMPAFGHGKDGRIDTEHVALEKRNSDLSRTVEGLRETVSTLWRFAFGVDTRAIRAPFGRFLVVRQGKACVALMITEHTRPEPSLPRWRGPAYKGARYTYYIQADGSGDFSRPNVKSGAGEVFEEANRPESSYIQVGGLKLRWTQHDWISFPRDAAIPVEMALTECIRIADVQAAAAEIVWFEPQKLERVASGAEQ